MKNTTMTTKNVIVTATAAVSSWGAGETLYPAFLKEKRKEKKKMTPPPAPTQEMSSL